MLKKVLKWIGVVFVGLILFVSCGTPDEEETAQVDNEETTEGVVEETSDEEVSVEEEEELLVIDAFELVEEYDANEARANNEYKDKRVKITGIVHSVLDRNGRPIVKLKGEEDFAVTDVEVDFGKKADEEHVKAFELDEGDEVTFIGTNKGISLFDIEIVDAVFSE